MRGRHRPGWFVRVGAAITVCALVLTPPGTAYAHPPGVQAAVDYRVTVAGVTPAAAGVTARFIDDGSRLELRSDSRTVEVLGYDGEPMLRVGPGGAWQNVKSPSLYVDQPGASARAGASAKVEPVWQQTSGRMLVRWQDHRALWHGNPPPQVRADPSRVHRVSDWTVRVRIDTVPGEITGSTEWVPPPSPGGWALTILVFAAAIAAAGALWRRRGSLARTVLVATGLCVGTAAVAYEILVAAHNAEPGAGAFLLTLINRPAEVLLGLALIVLALTVLAGRAGAAVLLIITGAATAFLVGLRNLALLSHAVAPVGVDPFWARLGVAVIVGGGAGLLGFALVHVILASQPVPRPASP